MTCNYWIRYPIENQKEKNQLGCKHIIITMYCVTYFISIERIKQAIAGRYTKIHTELGAKVIDCD